MRSGEHWGTPKARPNADPGPDPGPDPVAKSNKFEERITHRGGNRSGLPQHGGNGIDRCSPAADGEEGVREDGPEGMGRWRGLLEGPQHEGDGDPEEGEGHRGLGRGGGASQGALPAERVLTPCLVTH